MKRVVFAFAVLLGISGFDAYPQQNPTSDSAQIRIKKTADFQVSGTGNYAGWNQTDWITLPVQKASDKPLSTSAKLLYSDTGLYFLFRCEDEKLTATLTDDFADLYTEDVVEVFLWPDSSVPIYFEYELSPLNYELPILVPNINGKFHGWQPWKPIGSRKTQHATSVQGGQKTSNAPIRSWMAEFFIPYRLLSPIVQTPPTSGNRWRGNLYRIDYDRGYATWSWRRTSGSFHEFNTFGTLIFD